MRTLLASSLCFLALHTGCSAEQTWRAVDRMIQAQYPEVPTITTDSLAARLADSTRRWPVLLDARSPKEFAVSHLPRAHRIPPSADSIPGLDTLGVSTPIVVYCSVGYRSAAVTQRLQARGFRNVANLRGSLFRWANEGRTVVRNGQAVSSVHPYDQTWGTLLDDELHCSAPAACDPE